MKRFAYLGMATLLAAVAALLTLRAQHTVTVLITTRDLSVGTLVTADDVQLRHFHDDGMPPGALTDPATAVGRYVAWPLTGGEPVLGRALRNRRSGVSISSGTEMPVGYQAVAVAVQPANAVGGMLAPGDHVDAYAVPQSGHPAPPTVAGAPPDPPQRLGRDLLVLQLRTDQGQPLDDKATGSVRGLSFGTGKLGAVVLAVPAGDVGAFAQAANGTTVYLSLAVG